MKDNQDFSTPEPIGEASTEENKSVLTPFLTKHISDSSTLPIDNYHKYCYRHNPEVERNSTVDDDKMKNIQKSIESLLSADQQAITHVWSIFSAAPNNHRKLILQGILSQCCFPTLSFVSSEVTSLIKIDFISALPMEISLKILCYLDCASLCNAAQVLKNWKKLADDDRVWHHMCEQHIDKKCPKCGWGLPLMHMKRAREEYDEASNKIENSSSNYNNQVPTPVSTVSPPLERPTVNAINASESLVSTASTASTASVSTSSALASSALVSSASAPAVASVVASRSHPQDTKDRNCFGSDDSDSEEEKSNKRRKLTRRPWKSVYSERYKLEKNWRKGTYCIYEFVGHTDGVTCLQFNNKYMATGSYDTTIKIWDLATEKCIRTLVGHTKGLRSLVFDNQKLISCGLDSTIKVWNYHTGECVSTYRGHDDAVVSVDFLDKTIVSGSADHTVKVWHVDSRTCYTLRGHSDWVSSVKIHQPSNTAYSGSDDTTIKMWDLKTHKCIKTFGGVENNGHVGQVQCVIPIIYKDKLYDDRGDHELDLGDFEVVNDYNENENNNGNNNSSSNSNSENGEGNIGNVNNNNNNRESKYPTHLLSSSLDNTIKIWDVKTGKCIRTQFGHIEGVWSISADNFRIVSGANDRLIKVWDLQNGKCLHTFGNESGINCVGLSDSKFAAGLDNGIVKMYCFEP